MKRLVAFMFMVASAASLSAGEFDLPPGKWWQDQRLANRIGLSPDQQGRIRDLVYEHARRMIDLKADVDKAGLDLADAVNREEFDADAVRGAYARFQAARRKLENERFEMLLGVRQVLTSEQWKKMQEMKRRFQQARPKRPPGAGTRRPPGARPPGF